MATEPEKAAWAEQALRHSAAEVLAQFAGMASYLLDRADEARQLLAQERGVS